MKFKTASIIIAVILLSDLGADGFSPSFVRSTHQRKSCVRSMKCFSSGTILHSTKGNDEDEEKGFMDIMQPWKVDIPDEVREEIFKVEANTPAAKDRNTRVTLYVILTLLGIALSSCNVFLTNIRADAGASYNDLSSIEELGFGWVGSNPLTSFFLLNKIGGGIALLTAGFGGTMVELEQRTKNETAEKIWKELERRNEAASSPKSNKKKQKKSTVNKKNKKQKNKKRLDAFAELIVEEEPKQPAPEVKSTVQNEDVSKNEKREEKADEKGVVGKMKEFYKKADEMAASQALLLNKELEDRGVVEKITDETGLNVIGKDAAAALKKKKEEE